MIHQFNEAGLYCYKTGNNQIGTIIVEPRKAIIHIPIFGEHAGKSFEQERINKRENRIDLVHKMNTKDLVQFDWKRTDAPDDNVFITIDTNSSVVPDAAGGLTGIFDCGKQSIFKKYAHCLSI